MGQDKKSCLSCMENCNRCEDKNSCSECSPGFELLSIDGKTVCSKKCKESEYRPSPRAGSSSAECIRCANAKNNNRCLSCVDGSGECLKCIDGFRLGADKLCKEYSCESFEYRMEEGSSSVCGACSEVGGSKACSRCKDRTGECLSCKTGFTLVKNTENTNKNFCKRDCKKNGQFWTGNDKNECQECSEAPGGENCSECENLTGKCLGCTGGYHLLKNGTCHKTPVCSTAEYLYLNNKTGEISCQYCFLKPKNGHECQACEDYTGECITCANSYYLTEDKFCRKSCEKQFFWSGKLENDCKPCQGALQDCLECSDKTTCTACREGFMPLNSSVCARKCREGSYWDLSKYPAIRCLDCSLNPISGRKCTSCDQFGVCKQCLDGYYVNEEKFCQKNCSESEYWRKSEGNFCWSCKDDFARCHSCKFNQSLNKLLCWTCEEGYWASPDGLNCYRNCPRGYFLKTESNSCHRCPVRCLKCSNNTGICEECPLGYRYDHQNYKCVILKEVKEEVQKQKKLYIDYELVYFDQVEASFNVLFNREVTEEQLPTKFENLEMTLKDETTKVVQECKILRRSLSHRAKTLTVFAEMPSKEINLGTLTLRTKFSGAIEETIAGLGGRSGGSEQSPAGEKSSTESGSGPDQENQNEGNSTSSGSGDDGDRRRRALQGSKSTSAADDEDFEFDLGSYLKYVNFSETIQRVNFYRGEGENGLDLKAYEQAGKAVSWAMILLTPFLFAVSPYAALMITQFLEMANILKYFNTSLPTNAEVFLNQFERNFLTVIPINLNLSDADKTCSLPNLYKKMDYSCVIFNNTVISAIPMLVLLLILKQVCAKLSKLEIGEEKQGEGDGNALLSPTSPITPTIKPKKGKKGGRGQRGFRKAIKRISEAVSKTLSLESMILIFIALQIDLLQAAKISMYYPSKDSFLSITSLILGMLIWILYCLLLIRLLAGNLLNKQYQELQQYDGFKRSSTAMSIGEQLVGCFDCIYQYTYVPIRWSHLKSEDEPEKASIYIKYSPFLLILTNLFISGFTQSIAEKVPESLIWIGSAVGLYVTLTIIIRPFKQRILFYVEILRMAVFGVCLVILTALVQSTQEGRELSEKVRYKRLGNSLVYSLLFGSAALLLIGLFLVLRHGVALPLKRFYIRRKLKKAGKLPEKGLAAELRVESAFKKDKKVLLKKDTFKAILDGDDEDSFGFQKNGRGGDDELRFGVEKPIIKLPFQGKSKISVSHYRRRESGLMTPTPDNVAAFEEVKKKRTKKGGKAFNFAMSVDDLAYAEKNLNARAMDPGSPQKLISARVERPSFDKAF